MVEKLNKIIPIGIGLVILALVFSQANKPSTPPDDQWFQQAVLNQQKPVLVKYGADWCGPCVAMEPELDALEQAMGDKIVVVRVDVDQRRDLAKHYQISSIPRLMIFDKGNRVADKTGGQNVDQLKDWLASNLKK